MIRLLPVFLTSLAFFVPALLADEPPKKPTPDQQYQNLQMEYETALKEYRKAFNDAKTPQERQKLTKEYPWAKFAPRFLELAEKQPKDDAAFHALQWVINTPHPRTTEADELQKKAMKLLLHDHVSNEKIASVCARLGFSLDEESQQFLSAILEKSSHRSAKAQACLALAAWHENRLRLARRFKDTPELAKRYEPILGKESVDSLLKSDPDKLSKQSEAYYERIVKEFADVTAPDGKKVGDLAKNKLEALRHPILVGKPAPEIEGEDLDGKKFKLSDYRGKVVLLDFWGNW
jgi:hypothetical protein